MFSVNVIEVRGSKKLFEVDNELTRIWMKALNTFYWTPVRVCTFVLLFGYFLGIVSLVFSKFQHVARKLCMVEPDFLENIFCPNIGQKQGDLNLLKNFF